MTIFALRIIFFFLIFFIKRELYHLKAIEIACKFVKSTCPFVNHLIMTYHKHYNSNLECIVYLF